MDECGPGQAGQPRPGLSACMAICLLVGCGGPEHEDRQPTGAEINAYTTKIEQDEASAKVIAIDKSRAKEVALDREHRTRVPAQN